MSYNYGITLVDLDQMHIAEKFVANAISLLKYASPYTKQSMQKMEVSGFIEQKTLLQGFNKTFIFWAGNIHLYLERKREPTAKDERGSDSL